MLALILSSEGGGGLNPFSPDAIGGVLWTVVIFLVALPLMWKIVLGPITKALDERDGKLQGAIEQAQRASGEAEKARAAVEAKLSQAQREAAALMAQARERAEVRGRELEEAAHSQAKGMIESARREIQAEQERAIAAIRDEVVELALSGARAVLERNVGSEDDRRLVSGLVGGAKPGKGKKA